MDLFLLSNVPNQAPEYWRDQLILEIENRSKRSQDSPVRWISDSYEAARHLDKLLSWENVSRADLGEVGSMQFAIENRETWMFFSANPLSE